MADNTKDIIIKVNLDTKDVETEVQSLNTKLGGVGSNVNTQSFKSLKQELRESVTEAQNIGAKLGFTSQEFVKAAQKAADLKDQIADTNTVLKQFDPGNKLQGVVSIASGAISAIQGVAGAFVLMGVEAEDANVIIAKLQGLMALGNAVSAIGDIEQAYKGLSGVIKTSVLPSLFTLRGAFMALGIGLITTAVAFLVTNFDKIKESVGSLFPELKGLGISFNDVKQVVMGVGNAVIQFVITPITVAMKAIQGLKDFVKGDKTLSEVGKDVAGAFAKGYDVVGNFKSGKEGEIERQKAEAIEEARRKKAEEAAKRKTPTSSGKSPAVTQAKTEQEERLRIEKETAEKIKDINEEYYKWKKLKNIENANERKLAELQIEKNKELESVDNLKVSEDLKQQNRLAILRKYQPLIEEAEGKITAEKAEEEAQKRKEENEVKESEQSDFLKRQKDRLDNFNNQVKQKRQEDLDDEKLKKEKQVEYLNILGDARSALTDLAGKDTVASKALGIAQATINTFIGASEVLRAKSVLPEPFGTISKIANVAAIIGTGLSAVKNILKVNVPGKGGSGGSIPSSGSIPTAPQLQTSTIAAQVQNVRVVNQPGQAPIRAYITNDELRTNQEKQSFLNGLSNF